jgi:lysophospholipase L1-like esterase
VPEDEAGRIVGDAIIYNQVAEKIMRKNHIVINDLFTHAQKKLPNISKKKGDVHFSKEGYAYLAKKVAAEITKQLPAKQLP